jgi:hypothetical protein
VAPVVREACRRAGVELLFLSLAVSPLGAAPGDAARLQPRPGRRPAHAADSATG